MEITPEMLAEARERAEDLIEDLDEDQRWDVLREALVQDRERAREECMRYLQLEALRELVCPDVKRRDWAEGRAESTDLDTWLHRVRMAHSLGIRRGKL